MYEVPRSFTFSKFLVDKQGKIYALVGHEPIHVGHGLSLTHSPLSRDAPELEITDQTSETQRGVIENILSEWPASA